MVRENFVCKTFHVLNFRVKKFLDIVYLSKVKLQNEHAVWLWFWLKRLSQVDKKTRVTTATIAISTIRIATPVPTRIVTTDVSFTVLFWRTGLYFVAVEAKDSDWEKFPLSVVSETATVNLMLDSLFPWLWFQGLELNAIT